MKAAATLAARWGAMRPVRASGAALSNPSASRPPTGLTATNDDSGQSGAMIRTARATSAVKAPEASHEARDDELGVHVPSSHLPGLFQGRNGPSDVGRLHGVDVGDLVGVPADVQPAPEADLQQTPGQAGAGFSAELAHRMSAERDIGQSGQDLLGPHDPRLPAARGNARVSGPRARAG